MQASPEVLHSLEVPEAQAVAQSDLFGEVCDLPVLVDIRIQPVASVFGIRDGKEVDETWQQGYEQQAEGPPAPECKGSGSWRGAATLPTVFLVVVREDPGQAQAPVSNERKLSVLLGRVFTKSLTTRAGANLRVPWTQAAGRTAGRLPEGTPACRFRSIPRPMKPTIPAPYAMRPSHRTDHTRVGRADAPSQPRSGHRQPRRRFKLPSVG